MKLKSLQTWKKMNKEKGVAGLNIFLSVIAMLFVIGIIIMVFSLAGSELYDAVDDNTSKQVINDTKVALAGAVDWFDTFIVLAAMVVLILLVVIIINSIRQANITGGGA